MGAPDGPRRERRKELSGPRRQRELTTDEAAEELQVQRNTILQWVSRGHLQPSGKRGRQNLYTIGDLTRVKAEVADRTRTVPGTRANELASDFDKLVTGRIAARIAQVSESTIRMWVRRGHLKPAGRHGRRTVYTVVDVLRAARRPHHILKRW